jgi:sulfoacetaldehyde dehydrogenase
MHVIAFPSSARAPAADSGGLPDAGSAAEETVSRARAALAAFRAADQARIDRTVLALADAVTDAARLQVLARDAVRHSGLGNVGDTAEELRRRTLALADALLGVASTGTVARDDARGVICFARPAGVVAALLDAVDALPRAAALALLAVKARTPLVLAPSPAAATGIGGIVAVLRGALEQVGAPADLVQRLPPGPREGVRALLRMADVTIGPGRRADRLEANDAIAADGSGAVPVIVDGTADMAAAAAAIARSKTLDNGVSRAAETVVLVEAGVKERLLGALVAQGGWRLGAEETRRAAAILWRNGRLNRTLIGKDARVLAIGLGLTPHATGARFFLADADLLGEEAEAAGLAAQSLSLVLAVRAMPDPAAGTAQLRRLVEQAGGAAICGIHTAERGRAEALAKGVDAAVVVLDQGTRAALSPRAGTALDAFADDGVMPTLRQFLGVTRLLLPVPDAQPLVFPGRRRLPGASAQPPG